MSSNPPILNTPFKILGQQQTVEILGPTLTREVMEVTAIEEVHGIVFLVRVPLLDWKDGLTPAFVSPAADAIYIVLNQPLVVDASFVQTVRGSGHILDFLDIEVSPDGGDNSAILHQPFARLDLATVGPLIQALADNITTVQGLT